MKLFLFALLTSLPTLVLAQSSAPSAEDGTQVPVTFTGGHDTDPKDHGRPVVLVAAGLQVPTEVFREAFSHVHPAGPDHPPEPEQVRKNKEALMDALGKYGVTDERLNEVSNYYRYRSWAGELWTHVPATATATVVNGVVTGFTITNPGAGYSSAPQVSIQGMPDVKCTVKLSFEADLKKNGSIQEIAVAANP